MFEIAGHKVTYDEATKHTHKWYSQWTMTKKQNEEWVEFGVRLLIKEKHWTSYIAMREMMMFNSKYGLKIREE